MKEIIDLDTEVKAMESFLYHAIKYSTISSKDINKELDKNDIDFLELVKEYIEKDLYPKHKNEYVSFYEDGNFAVYCKSSKENPDAFLFTDILDKELVHLNTCIKIMKQNNSFLSKYIDIFNYDRFEEIYGFIYNTINNYTYSYNSYLSEIFNIDDLENIVKRLNADDILVLKAFSDAKTELPSVQDLYDSSFDKIAHYNANSIITEAYYKNWPKNKPRSRK